MVQVVHRADPLAGFDDDYSHAVVHLVWAVERRSQARVLLCGAVELLPREVQPSIAIGERFMTVSNRYFVYSDDVVVTAQRGLRWFEEAAMGTALRPRSKSFDDNVTTATPLFVVNDFDEEPPRSWVCARTRLPWLASWHESARVRHLVPHQSPMTGWTEEERASTCEWIQQQLHVDLVTFPEYVGSIHLIAPNPTFRSLTARQHADASGRPCLVVALVLRSGRSVAGLKLLIEEKRSSGVGLLASIDMQHPVVRIELPHYPEQIRERVIDPQRGVLYDGSFGMFGVGFSLAVNVVSTFRRVTPPDAGASYEVALTGQSVKSAHEGSSTGQRDGAARLHRARIDRERTARGSKDQKWFRDRAADAVAALRELLEKAEGSVLICDPYFGAHDILRLVLAIANPATAVRILTSAAHLRDIDDRKDRGRLLQKQVELLSDEQQPTNPIEVRVMGGEKPSIHDRFIFTKTEAWMLGASINNFGTRGTLLVRVPDPAPIAADLERVWSDSPPLVVWLAARAKATK